MVLNYYGMEADKVEMATKYLPTQELNLYYGSDGRLYGNDLNQYFIGNPTTENGYVCGTGAVSYTHLVCFIKTPYSNSALNSAPDFIDK